MLVEGDSSAALNCLSVRAQLYRCNAAGEVDPAGQAVPPACEICWLRLHCLYCCRGAGEGHLQVQHAMYVHAFKSRLEPQSRPATCPRSHLPPCCRRACSTGGRGVRLLAALLDGSRHERAAGGGGCLCGSARAGGWSFAVKSLFSGIFPSPICGVNC